MAWEVIRAPRPRSNSTKGHIMQYTQLAGENVSRFGFGAMRLPMRDGHVDEAQTFKMVRYAMSHGVNYFDTAYPYMNCESEIVLGKALKQFPRESYFLATKFPGHQIAESYDVAAIFEEQLAKCDVDYFDFYLLHNVYENSLSTYMDPQWGIVDYLLEQKRAGRIHHLGFSTHAMLPCLETFLDRYGADMEFAQIQMNYLDWSLQDGAEKYALLEKYGLDVIVMEPLRGGALADLGEETNAQLRAMEPGMSIASWAMRWQFSTPAKVVLSGVSDMAQLMDNVATFDACKPLSITQAMMLIQIADNMKDNVGCTACRYCCDVCPREIDIPLMMKLADEARVSASFGLGMTLDAIEEGHRPADCITCGACEQLCPQGIAIPDVLAELVSKMEGVPHWADLCKQRDEAAAKLREAAQED